MWQIDNNNLRKKLWQFANIFPKFANFFLLYSTCTQYGVSWVWSHWPVEMWSIHCGYMAGSHLSHWWAGSPRCVATVYPLMITWLSAGKNEGISTSKYCYDDTYWEFKSRLFSTVTAETALSPMPELTLLDNVHNVDLTGQAILQEKDVAAGLCWTDAHVHIRNIQTDIHNRWIDKHTDRQTDRQTDRCAHTYTCAHARTIDTSEKMNINLFISKD